MTAPLYQTRGELRAELSGRLGFGATGASAGINQTNLNSIISRAQDLLYWTHDWSRLRRYTDVDIGVNQYLVDYPDTCNPERIKAIALNTGTAATPVWSSPLKRGISSSMYTTQGNTGPPWRWEPYEQIEFFPKANQLYSARVFYVRTLNPLTDDAHRTTIESTLVFIVALARAKAHYRHPDAKIYGDDSEALLLKLKSKSWGKDVFSPNDYLHDDQVLAKPVVV